ncbi:hypothetical protein MAHJHV50_37910 [Mycobacterium avium subsp. hominissuis]
MPKSRIPLDPKTRSEGALGGVDHLSRLCAIPNSYWGDAPWFDITLACAGADFLRSNDQNLWMSLGGAREKWAHLPEDDLKVQ